MSEDLREFPAATMWSSPGEMPAPARPPAPRVFLLADDAARASAWRQALASEGIDVQPTDRDRLGVEAVQAVILHCTRRLTDQLGILRDLRQADGARALVVVCVDPRELEQVLALEMGADDVIDAATSAPVVAARLRALWRRNGLAPGTTQDELSFGRLSLHLRERRVQLGAERIALTECEFEVLWLLATQAGRAVSRTELLERLRGLPYQRIDRSIDCRIYRIRAKLRDSDGATQHIRTVRNCGYLFSPARW